MTDCSGMARRDTAGDGQTTGGAPPRKRAGLGFGGGWRSSAGRPGKAFSWTVCHREHGHLVSELAFLRVAS